MQLHNYLINRLTLTKTKYQIKGVQIEWAILGPGILPPHPHPVSKECTQDEVVGKDSPGEW